ncbi:MAG: flagellar basal body rod protein FlgF [Legionellales bacterium]|nr:flagellar basal body rod protein FlgF [Legionellales bacterium]
MDRAVYISANSASHLWNALRINNNNLANVSTTGFREELMSLASQPIEGQALPGRVNAYISGTHLNTDTGPLITTGNPLDIAIKQKGWIGIQNKMGQEALTRVGDLHADVNGVLMTSAGYAVMGNSGPIALPPHDKILIGADGTVSIQPQGQPPENIAAVDRIRLVNPPANTLYKGDDGLIYSTAGGVNADANVQLITGALEGSNANAVDGLVKMISIQQQLQQNLAMLKTIDEQAQDSVRMIQIQ